MTTFTCIEDARREGFDTFMFTTTAARAAFVTAHPGGVEYTDETHSRGDVFRLFCYAVKPRAGVCTFVRAQ